MTVYKYPNPLQFLAGIIAGLPTDEHYRSICGDLRSGDLEYHISQGKYHNERGVIEAAIRKLQPYQLPSVLTELILWIRSAMDEADRNDIGYMSDRAIFEHDPTKPYTLHIRVVKTRVESQASYEVCWFLVRNGAATDAIAKLVTEWRKQSTLEFMPLGFFSYVTPPDAVERFDSLCRYFKGMPAMHIHDLPMRSEPIENHVEQLTQALKLNVVDGSAPCWQALESEAADLARMVAQSFLRMPEGDVITNLYGYGDDYYLVIIHPHHGTYDVYVWYATDTARFTQFIGTLEYNAHYNSKGN